MKKYVLTLKWSLLILLMIVLRNTINANGSDPATKANDPCQITNLKVLTPWLSPGKLLFSDDPFFGESDNYEFLFPTPEDWGILEHDGNMYIGLTTSSLDPIHPSGNPWTDPDGVDGPLGAGGESALGGVAVLKDTVFTEFEITTQIARPGVDAENENYDFALIFDFIDAENYTYVNVNANPGSKSSTVVKVIDGVGLRGQNAEFWSDDLPSFPGDTLFHQVILTREDSTLVLTVDGKEVLNITQEQYGVTDGGRVGFGSWNDAVNVDDFYVESIAGRAPSIFSSSPYFGDADNYSFIYPDADAWETIFLEDENVVLALNTSNINPTHPSGNPYIDPDGPDGPLNGGSESALGGVAVAMDSVYSDFEMTLILAKPPFESENTNYDFGFVFGYIDSDNYSYVNVNANLESKNSTVVKVVDGIGTRGQYSDAWSDDLPTFPDDFDFHDISLKREGNTVILTIDGNEVLNVTDEVFNLPGLVGIGSWNDGGYFDDISVVSLGGLSGLANVETTTVGSIDGSDIIDIPVGTTAGELLSALTFSDGAAGAVLDDMEMVLPAEEVLDSSDFVRVTAENGVTTKDYAILFFEGLSDDTSIDAVFSPFSFDTLTSSIIGPDGATASFALDKIRPSDMVSAMESVVNANGDNIGDDVTITEDMSYRVIAESGVFQDYPFIIAEPTYPTASLNPSSGIIMDAFFDDWTDIETRFEIDLVNVNSGNPDFAVAPEEDDLSGYFKATWDSDYLYLYFNINDDIISAGNTEVTYQNDGPEITLLMASDLESRSLWNPFFQPSTQLGFSKLHVIPGGNIALATQYGLNTGVSLAESDNPEVVRDWTGGVVETWPKDDESGYEIEMQLPWVALNGPDNPNAVTPEMGSKFSIAIALNDNDGGDGRESILHYAHTNTNGGGENYAIFTLGESSGIFEVIPEELQIFPNPAQSRIIINHESDIEHVTIFNVTSQVVHSKSYAGSVQVSNLPQGTYYIKALTAEGKLVSGKFVKI